MEYKDPKKTKQPTNKDVDKDTTEPVEYECKVIVPEVVNKEEDQDDR